MDYREATTADLAEIVALLADDTLGATRKSLAKTGSIILIDRSQLTAVLDEKALQQSVCTKGDCGADLGNLAGAKQIVGFLN